MIELEKYPISRIKNLLNQSGQQFYKISKVIQCAHIVPKNTENDIFYLDNYINWNQLNQLYNPEWPTKEI